MSIHFEWTKDISVGNDIIDRQHQKLLAQINKIIDSVIFGVNSKEVNDAVHFFEEYIKEHLSFEEAYMEKIHYPNLADHKKQHASFVDNYADFKKRLGSSLKPEAFIIEIETYLGEWWFEHIGKEDKKYHLFLEANSSK